MLDNVLRSTSVCNTFKEFEGLPATWIEKQARACEPREKSKRGRRPDIMLPSLQEANVLANDLVGQASQAAIGANPLQSAEARHRANSAKDWGHCYSPCTL